MFWTLPQHALNNLLPVMFKTFHLYLDREQSPMNCVRLIFEMTLRFCLGFGENTYNVDEYRIGSGEMEDLLILLISPAMSC